MSIFNNAVNKANRVNNAVNKANREIKFFFIFIDFFNV
jgi:hypothetical protein